MINNPVVSSAGGGVTVSSLINQAVRLRFIMLMKTMK